MSARPASGAALEDALGAATVDALDRAEALSMLEPRALDAPAGEPEATLVLAGSLHAETKRTIKESRAMPRIGAR